MASRDTALLGPTPDGDRYELTSPTALPKAGGFLWNQKMMIHFTCQGYATAQYMQPEPAKYSHAPNIKARTFMQPEQNYYTHHPGRFVYVKDEETGKIFLAPHEPVRAEPERFVFSAGKSDASFRRTFGHNHPTRHDPRYLDESLKQEEDYLERRVTRWTPLHVAVCKGNLDCAEQLIACFGLPSATESDDSVLAEARQFFRSELVLFSLSRLSNSTLNHVIPRLDPLPSFHIAAATYTSVGALARVYAMLEQAGCCKDPQPIIDTPDAFGNTAFAVAAFSGRIQTFGSWLRDHGANINFALCDRYGNCSSIFTALCKYRRFKEALFLMDLDIDIHTDTELHSGDRLDSALHACCWDGEGKWRYKTRPTENIMVIKRLISAGADVNARAAEDGETALILAVKAPFHAAVRELLEAKADTKAESDSGNSALVYAVDYALWQTSSPGPCGVLDTIQLLLDHGANPNQSSRRFGLPLFLEYRVKADPSLDIKRVWWPHNSGRNNMVAVVLLLIAGGADLNVYFEDPRDLGEALISSLPNSRENPLLS